MLKEFDEREGEGRRDVVFIPVGINYDRVLEDRSQLLKLHPERKRAGMGTALWRSLGFFVRNLGQMGTGRWHRFGYACVNFGTPLSMREWCAGRGVRLTALAEDARRAEVAAVGTRLMDAVGRVVPVLPVSLVASLMMEAPRRAWSALELKAAALARIERLAAAGARLYVPRGDQDYAIDVGLRMLTLRHLVIERDGMFAPAEEDIAVLAYYANAIGHIDPAAA